MNLKFDRQAIFTLEQPLLRFILMSATSRNFITLGRSTTSGLLRLRLRSGLGSFLAPKTLLTSLLLAFLKGNAEADAAVVIARIVRVAGGRTQECAVAPPGTTP